MAVNRFLDTIDRVDWRNAAIGAVVLASLLVLMIGCFFGRDIFDKPESALFIGVVMLLAGAMFGVFGGVTTLVFSVMLRQFPHANRFVCAEYEAFARSVGGKVSYRERRFLGLRPSMPEMVRFSHAGHAVELAIIMEEPDEAEVVGLTFHLAEDAEFTCHVYPAGLSSRLGELVGIRDVQIGSPEFDERFVVKASNELRAVDILDRQVQEAWLELVAWADGVRNRSVLGSRYVELRAEPHTLQIRLRAVLITAADLMAYAELGKRLCDHVNNATGEMTASPDGDSPR